MSRKGKKKESIEDETSPEGMVIKEDLLFVGASLSSTSKKDWKQRLICLRQRTESGYVRLEVYRNTKVRPQFQTAHTIPLSPDLEVYYPFGCPHKNAFVVEGPDDVIFLAAKSEEQRSAWANCLQSLELFKPERLKGGECFEVVGEQGPGLEDLKGVGDGILAIDCEHVYLARRRSKEVVAKWPLPCIRRYSCEHRKFVLEAGRRSPRGEGRYVFLSGKADEAFHTLEGFIQQMAKTLVVKKDPAEADSKSPASHRRPPALAPPTSIPKSSSSGGSETVPFESPGYWEIPPEGFGGAGARLPNGDYARTQHGPEPSQLPAPDGLYNTLQHTQEELDKARTWRSTSVDSKAQYQVAKHPSAGEQTNQTIYDVAFVPTATSPQSQPPVSPPGAELPTTAAANPTYWMTGPPETETPPPALPGKPPQSQPEGLPELPAKPLPPRQYRSSLLRPGDQPSEPQPDSSPEGKGKQGPPEEDLPPAEQQQEEEESRKKRVARSYSSVDKSKNKRTPEQKRAFAVLDSDNKDEEAEEDADEADLTLSASPPTLPPRHYTKSECDDLDGPPEPPPSRVYTKSECDELDGPPEPPPSRVYTKSECDELLLSSGLPPDLPNRSYGTDL